MLANFIKGVIAGNQLLDGHYAEVYAGGAGIAWPLLFEEYVRFVHINDVDPRVTAFWRSVLNYTDELCRLIELTPVSMDEWYRQRAVHDAPRQHSTLELGFSTFFLNRTNRSGILGAGVIGGKQQAGEWKLDARYNKPDLIERVRQIARYSSRIQVYELDAVDFINDVLPTLPTRSLRYLDPPYFHKGQDLYRNYYGAADHEQIAILVSKMEQPWIVSYDSVPEICSLYEQLPKIEYQISYSAQSRYAGAEVIFYHPDLTMPDVESPVSMKKCTQKILNC